MCEEDATAVAVISTLVLIVMTVAFVSSCSYKDGHKDGYIEACGDARQGKLRYELKENPDGTRIWEEKKK